MDGAFIEEVLTGIKHLFLLLIGLVVFLLLVVAGLIYALVVK